MAENEKKIIAVRVKIRPAKWQDFENAENPSGVSSGMRFLLGTPESGFKTYRVSESTRRERLVDHIERGLVWVPCSGFESEVKLQKPNE